MSKHDIEQLVIDLEDAMARMIAAKRAAKDDEERMISCSTWFLDEATIEREYTERVEQIEVEFAHHLADAYERGVPQSVIRSRVLRTSDWATWTKWRDLAGISLKRKERDTNG